MVDWFRDVGEVDFGRKLDVEALEVLLLVRHNGVLGAPLAHSI